MNDYIEIDVDNIPESGYKRFVVKSIGDKFDKKIESVDKQVKTVLEKVVGKKKKINSLFYYLAMVFAFISVILALLLFNEISSEKTTFPTLIVVLTIIFLLLTIVFVVLQFWSKKKLKEAFKSEEVNEISTLNQDLENELKEYLNVPLDSKKMDVFVRQIRYKNGTKINAISQVSYSNNDLYAFKKDEKVYFSDTYELIELDLKKVRNIELIKDKISFINWNKKVPFSDNSLKEYQIRPIPRGGFVVNCFFEIKIEANSQELILRIPGYEKEMMKELFDYPIEEEIKKVNLDENQESGN